MGRSLNIILIEDDREIGRGLLVRLTAAGHHTTALHDGASGLSAAFLCATGLDSPGPALAGYGGVCRPPAAAAA